MNEHHHFWSFKTKDQRRFENDKAKMGHQASDKEHAGELAAHTRLDHNGRKGFIGLSHSMPSFFRHTRNAIYARWARSQVKQ